MKHFGKNINCSVHLNKYKKLTLLCVFYGYITRYLGHLLCVLEPLEPVDGRPVPVIPGGLQGPTIRKLLIYTHKIGETFKNKSY